MFLPTKTLDKNEGNERGVSSKVSKPDLFIYQHPESDESFLDERPSKVQEVIECLEAIENANKTDSSKTREKSTLNISDLQFLVTHQKARKSSVFRRPKTKKVPINTNQFTFMRQIDSEPEDRILARKQREDVAETFRRMGNHEYRKLNFSLAKNYYTKGLEYIKDTPVLYVNRAMCFIKMREFKLGIMDCDYVIAKLDGNYLRAWLYRAAAYKRLNDEANFEDSVSLARRLNRTQNAFIDDFLDKMRSLL
ncbi:tetratricopeptide repeat protein 12 [Drosophila biarmipes]|uniref:tetratricopeptide repeat protein 12 n=1 Tax=Drosophila biarmipes TaxID=125945 RepID=UPI0007E828D5|nr:tetratricopeptide repeat protein 12 [Drosophila biarmipes]